MSFKTRPHLAAVTALACLLLGGCAETQLAMHAYKGTVDRPSTKTPNSVPPHYKVGSPYQIDGVWYYPAENPNYAATGTASWYGDAFHGKTTANGEVFDKEALTAAHPTLPLPSQVRVTNLRNGKSLELRVNDRGPFVDRRIIDVSQVAARQLGFETEGTAPVRVEIMADESQRLKLLALKNDPDAAKQVAVIAAPVPSVAIAEWTPPPAAATPVSAPARPAPASIVAAAPSVAQPTSVASVVRRAAAPAPVQMAALGQSTDTPAPRAKPAPASAAKAASVAKSVAAARPSAAPSQGVFVQAGAFRSYENAVAMRKRLEGFGPVMVSPTEDGGTTWYRVRLGPSLTVADAQNVKQRLAAAGIADSRLVTVQR